MTTIFYPLFACSPIHGLKMTCSADVRGEADSTAKFKTCMLKKYNKFKCNKLKDTARQKTC